ncbi:MAG: hypothetical protein CVU00_11110 [Bacteroidetes bacterium HGW-Bacteroidetes-17]|jgi:hypothetical protein|nr:MAG: hypothetical protein CVU00_11110 [Bacteroidetes bacterium HGW-Bacteroidetes-17]
MKNEDVLSKGFQDAIKFEPLLISKETGFIAKIGKGMKKVIFIGGLAGIGLLFTGCAPRYVATVPAYHEYSRPQRPSDQYIWIDGNWTYNRQTNMYVQQNGYWQRPHQSRTFVRGYWQASPRGHYWIPGKWQKQDKKSKGNNRNGKGKRK